MSRMSGLLATEIKKVLEANTKLLHFVVQSKDKNIDIFEFMKPSELVLCLDSAEKMGIKIDIDRLTAGLEPIKLLENAEILEKYNAKIDYESVAKKIDLEDVIRNIDFFNERKVKIDIDDALSKITNYFIISDRVESLLHVGANANLLASKLYKNDIVKHFDKLLACGADINILISKIDPFDVFKRLDWFIKNGAKINIDELSEKLKPYQILYNLDDAMKYGIKCNLERIIPRVFEIDIAENFDAIVRHGYPVNKLVGYLGSSAVDKIDLFKKYYKGNLFLYDIRLDEYKLDERLDYLVKEYDADVKRMMQNMTSGSISKSIDTLIEHGADINDIVALMQPRDVVKYFDKIMACDVNRKTIVSVFNSEYSRKRYYKELAAHGIYFE